MVKKTRITGDASPTQDRTQKKRQLKPKKLSTEDQLLADAIDLIDQALADRTRSRSMKAMGEQENGNREENGGQDDPVEGEA